MLHSFYVCAPSWGSQNTWHYRSESVEHCGIVDQYQSISSSEVVSSIIATPRAQAELRQRVERAPNVLAVGGRPHDDDTLETERALNLTGCGNQRVGFLTPRFGGERKPRIVNVHVAITCTLRSDHLSSAGTAKFAGASSRL